MAVAVERALEAPAGITAYRCPRALVVLVGFDDELQVLAAAHRLDGLVGSSTLQRDVTVERAFFADGYGLLFIVIGLLVVRQVDELLQQLCAVLAVGTRAVVVEVYLRLAVHVLVVYVVVVLLVVHQLAQVVVVGHGELYGIRVGAAEVRLGIIGHVVVVLVPVQVGGVVVVGYAVAVQRGIAGIGKHLPSGTGNLEGTGFHARYLHAHAVAGYDGGGLLQRTYLGHARLELQVYVHDVSFGHRHHVVAALVALVVLVEEDGRDDLLLLQVVDVRLAADVERRGLHGCRAVDDEACLQVHQLVEVSLVDEDILRYC